MTVVRAGASLAYTELVLKCTKIKANVGQSSRALAKGQLISECPFDFPKNPEKFDKFLP